MVIWDLSSPGPLPLGDRRRIVQFQQSLLLETADEGSGEALALGPALHQRVLGDAFGVALGHQPSLVDHDQTGGAGRRLESHFHRRLQLLLVHLRRQRILGQKIAHGPGLGLGIRKGGANRDRVEVDAVVVLGMDDAALVPVELGRPREGSAQCGPDQAVLVVNGLGDLSHVGGREAHQRPCDPAGVFDRRLFLHFRDEDRGAEQLGVTRHAQAADILVLGFRYGFGCRVPAGTVAGGGRNQSHRQRQ